MRKLLSKRTVRVRVLIQTLFWAVSFYILLKIFVGKDDIESIDIIYTFLFQLTIAPFIYINLLWLKPQFLTSRRWLIYILAIAILILIGTEFNLFFFNKFIDILLPDYYFISYYGHLEIAQFLLGHLIIITLLQFSIEWFEWNREEKRVAQIEKERAQFEMRSLLSQINPHFLFNTLNSLYSLILNKKEEAGNYVLKLSDVLRYVIYHSKEPEITLQSEIDLINDYIFLQKMRTDFPNVDFETVGKLEEWKIAPMLILPLIENAFKHGLKDQQQSSKIVIRIIALINELNVEVTNKKHETERKTIKELKGIGLENIRRRLEIAYPERHKLLINENENQFSVNLKLWNPSSA